MSELRKFCTDYRRDSFFELSESIREDMYRIAQVAQKKSLGDVETVKKVIEYYVTGKIDKDEQLTEQQYIEYGEILQDAARSNRTLDSPPVTFSKEKIVSHIKYRRPKTLGDTDRMINVDIKKLVKFMGTDDTALAHTKLYNRDSTDLLAWLLGGVHFHAHKSGDQDITYGKNETSYIKYLLDKGTVEIPKIVYNPSSGLFDIEDGRHRLGLYLYFNIDGTVYTNKSGFSKLKELGGKVPTPPKPQPKKTNKTEIEIFKERGVWDLALKAVDSTTSEKAALKVPSGLRGYSQNAVYKRAIQYIYKTSSSEDTFCAFWDKSLGCQTTSKCEDGYLNIKEHYPKVYKKTSLVSVPCTTARKCEAECNVSKPLNKPQLLWGLKLLGQRQRVTKSGYFADRSLPPELNAYLAQSLKRVWLGHDMFVPCKLPYVPNGRAYNLVGVPDPLFRDTASDKVASVTFRLPLTAQDFSIHVLVDAKWPEKLTKSLLDTKDPETAMLVGARAQNLLTVFWRRVFAMGFPLRTFFNIQEFSNEWRTPGFCIPRSLIRLGTGGVLNKGVQAKIEVAMEARASYDYYIAWKITRLRDKLEGVVNTDFLCKRFKPSKSDIEMDVEENILEERFFQSSITLGKGPLRLRKGQRVDIIQARGTMWIVRDLFGEWGKIPKAYLDFFSGQDLIDEAKRNAPWQPDIGNLSLGDLMRASVNTFKQGETGTQYALRQVLLKAEDEEISRKELQAEAKKYGVKANLRTAQLVEELHTVVENKRLLEEKRAEKESIVNPPLQELNTIRYNLGSLAGSGEGLVEPTDENYERIEKKTEEIPRASRCIMDHELSLRFSIPQWPAGKKRDLERLACVLANREKYKPQLESWLMYHNPEELLNNANIRSTQVLPTPFMHELDNLSPIIKKWISPHSFLKKEAALVAHRKIFALPSRSRVREGEEGDFNIWPAGPQRIAPHTTVTRPKATNTGDRWKNWRSVARESLIRSGYGDYFDLIDRDDLSVGWAHYSAPFITGSVMPPKPYGRSTKYDRAWAGHTVSPEDYLGWTGGVRSDRPWSHPKNTFPYRISRAFVPNGRRAQVEYTSPTGLKTREKVIVAVPRGASLALYYRNTAYLFHQVAWGVNNITQDRTLFLKTVANENDLRMSSGDLRKVVIPTRVVATYKTPLDVSIDLGGIKRVIVKFKKEKIKKRAASKKAQVEQWKIAAKRAGYYEYDAGEKIVTIDKLYDYLMATKKRRKLTPLESEWLDDDPVYDSDDEE